MQCFTFRPRRSLSVAFSTLCLALNTAPTISHAAEPDIPQAQNDARHYSVKQEIQLGAEYLTGRGIQQDLAQSAYWYERAANAGDPLAQNQIGYYYQAGIGVQQDSVRAAQWYQRAADGGFLTAKVNLGLVYLWGIGVRKDPQLAYELIHDAAMKNSGVAMAYLGEMYNFGIGLDMDRKAARGWYERGAHANNNLAEYRLAASLIAITPSKEDLHRAVKLFRKSIDGGYVPAQHSLGVLLAQHPELSFQNGEAVTLLQNASNAGIWQSSAILGAMYRDGNGVPRDHSRAYYYFQLAQRQGGPRGHQMVNSDLVALSQELSPAETYKLVAEANQWVNSHPLTLMFLYKDTGSSSEFTIFAITAANDDTHTGKLIPAPSSMSNP